MPADVARTYLLERVDEAAVVQLYADGFEALPVHQRILIWHLYQAAIAGRDIFYDQRYAHNLDMRDVLEAIVTHIAVETPPHDAEIERYTKLFWINSGPYNNLTARKFVLKCTPEQFAAAAHAAAAKGAAFPLRKGESLDALLQRLKPMFFDATVDPSVTTKTPADGRDILQASANNLYSGVTMNDLERIRGAIPAQFAAREEERNDRRRGLSRRRDVRPADLRGDRPSGSCHPYAHGADGQGVACADPVVSHRRGARSARVRHRLGGRQVVAGRHDQRFYRGLPRRPRHEGRVGSAGLLRQHDQDRRDPETRRRSAVVREPNAVGPRSTAKKTCKG